MRKIKSILFLVSLSLFSFSCSNSDKPKEKVLIVNKHLVGEGIDIMGFRAFILEEDTCKLIKNGDDFYTYIPITLTSSTSLYRHFKKSRYFNDFGIWRQTGDPYYHVGLTLLLYDKYDRLVDKIENNNGVGDFLEKRRNNKSGLPVVETFKFQIDNNLFNNIETDTLYYDIEFREEYID